MSSANEIAKRLLRRRLNEAKEKINYSELDHEDLVRMARNEDDKAFEELMKQYNPLISKIVRKYVLESGHGDEEDVRQIATIAFWNAVESYDPSAHKKGFGSYASTIMDRKLTDELRKDSAEKRQIYNVTNSTEDVLGYDGEGGQFTLGDTLSDEGQLSPEEYYLGKDGAQKIMNFMMNNFSEKERDVVMRKIKGESISDIMEETGMKYKAVENTLKRIKDKLAEYLRNRESKKIRESAGVEFSDEEKKILGSVIAKVDEQLAIREMKMIDLKAAYENYTEEQLDKELEEIEADLEDIFNELERTYYDDRDELLSQIEDIKYKLTAMDEFLTPTQYEKEEELYHKASGAEDVEYNGPKRKEVDPYKERGLRMSDFF